MHLKAAVPTTLDDDDIALMDDIPKATIYAIAKDFAIRIAGEQDDQLARNEIIGTWHTLHSNGVVKQPVPKKHIMRDSDGEELAVVITPRRKPQKIGR